MKKIYFSVLFSILLYSICTAQTNDDYRSRTSGDWNDPNTWERFNGSAWQVATNPPSSANGVISIRSSHTVNLVMPANGDQLVIDSGGIFSIYSDLALANGSGNDLTVNGILDFQSGIISGAGTITLNNIFNWFSGTISSPTIIASTGIVNYAPTNVTNINANFTNNGTINWTSGDFPINNSVFANNAAFNMSGTVDDLRLIGSGSFVNNVNGTVTKTAANLMSLKINFNNKGLINVQDGKLRNQDTSFISAGTINISAGKTFQNTSVMAFNQGTIFSGTGTLELTGSEVINTPLTISSVLTLLDGGGISGSGPLTFNGVLTYQTGIINSPTTIASTGVMNFAPTNIASISANFTNNGTVNWTSADFPVNNSVFTNNAAFNMSGTVDNLRLIGSGSFVNNVNGTVTKTAANLMSLKINFNNKGLINVQDGKLRNQDTSFISAGTINISAGKTFQNTSVMAFNQGTIFSGTGTLELTGSEVINTPLTISSVLTLLDGGGISGSGPLTFNGVLSYATGILSSPTIIASTGIVNYAPTNVTNINANFTNNGTINWTSGDFPINNSVFANNAAFNMSGTVDDLRLIGSGSFVNNVNGTVTKTAANLMSLKINFNNKGLINVQDGKLRNQDTSFISAGTINISAGKTFQNTSVMAFNQGTIFSGTGTLELTGSEVINTPLTISSVLTLLDGGGISGSGPLTFNGVLTYQTGIINSPTIIASTGVMNFAPTNIASISANFTNNGTVNWTSADFPVNNSVFTNNAAFNMSGTVDNLRLIGSGSFVNNVNGTVTKTAANLMSLKINFNNKGLINVQDGKLRNQDTSFISAGTINISAGKTFQNTSVMAFNQGTIFSGTGTLELTGSEVINTPLTISSVLTLLDGGGISGSGPLTFNGVLTYQTGIINSPTTIASTGVMNFAPTNIASISANFTNNGTVNWTSADFPVNNSVFTNNAAFNMSGTVDNLRLTGSGSFVNSSGGTIAKTTNTLIYCDVPLTSSGVINGIGAIRFANVLNNNGTIAPGTSAGNSTNISIGILTINGAANPLTASSTIDIEIFNNVGSGVGYDQLQRDGNLALAGTLKVRETGVVVNGTFTIISLTSGIITGNFSTVILPAGYTLQQSLTTVTVTKALALPLTLVALEATEINNNVLVKWSTLSEQNIASYNVEHSTNAINYTVIGNVLAKGANPNKQDYYLQHTQPVKGNNFYRLAILGRDGNVSYSTIIKIAAGTKAKVQAYPNPTRGLFIISGLSAGKKNQIQVINQSGTTLQQYTTYANTLLLNLNTLPAGIYFVIVNDERLKINKQ